MQKYLLQQPKTLETLAIARVADWVTIQAEDLLSPVAKLQDRYPTKAKQLLSRKIKHIRRFVQGHIPNFYCNKLASELLKKIPELLKKRNLLLPRPITNISLSEHMYVCDPVSAYNVVSRVIEIMFTKNLTYLLLDDPGSEVDISVLDYNTWDIFKSSFCSKSHMLSGIVSLQIISCSKNDDIIQLLKELHSLKYLCLTNANHNVLKCIVDNCKLIEELLLDYNKEVTDHSIDILIQLRNLKHVSLNGTTVTKAGIARILLCCEMIEGIYVVDKKGIIEFALEDIDSAEELVEKQFKLTSFHGSHETTAEQLKLVIKMCPRLQKVTLSENHMPHGYLLHLRDLTDLRHLSIHGLDFYIDGVKDLLDARGYGLVQLDLLSIRGLDSIALACICRTCPNLQSLYFRKCTFQKDTFHMIWNSGKLRIMSLKYLKKITLVVCDTKPSNDQLIFLLSVCPNVEYVDIREANLLTDQILYQIMKGRNWMHLKELKLCKAGISTKYVIDLIIQTCIGQPEVLIYIEFIQ